MKLLITSAGIKNKTIAKAVLDLAGKKAEEISVAFIPTAMNPTGNDKTWFIDNLYVLFFSGGTSPHLMYWVKKFCKFPYSPASECAQFSTFYQRSCGKNCQRNSTNYLRAG